MTPRVYERKFDWDEARRLRAQGLSYGEIGRRLGVSATAIQRVCDAAYHARDRARLAAQARRGICVDCGAPASHNYSRPVARCKPCADARRPKVKDGQAYCPTCKTWKPLSDFSPSKQKTNRGVHGECKSCQAARRQAWREANRERQRAYDRERRRRQRAKVAA